MNDDPQLEIVGHREGDYIVWDDGSQPTLLPEDLRTKPAFPVCRNEDDQ